MYEEIKKDLIRKLLELKLWLQSIDNKDQISKGLFFVYIYGIYEKTVVDLVTSVVTY